MGSKPYIVQGRSTVRDKIRESSVVTCFGSRDVDSSSGRPPPTWCTLFRPHNVRHSRFLSDSSTHPSTLLLETLGLLVPSSREYGGTERERPFPNERSGSLTTPPLNRDRRRVGPGLPRLLYTSLKPIRGAVVQQPRYSTVTPGILLKKKRGTSDTRPPGGPLVHDHRPNHP